MKEEDKGQRDVLGSELKYGSPPPLIYLRVGRVVAIHSGESRVTCIATTLPTELSPR
jgi:hypothetical protein